MASGTGRPTAPDSSGSSGQQATGRVVGYQQYIERQLKRTGRQVKGVDITASLLRLAAGTLAYLLIAALVDHWLVPGGLGFWGRLLCLIGFAGGAVGYLVVDLLPLLLRRINPVFAAHTIERSRPTLKNSLINFLLLRSGPDKLPPAVYDAVEEQAAQKLSAVPVETVVDRSPLIRLGWILMAIVAVVSLYQVISPKNPLVSVRRVVFPWADIAAPTRVTIEAVEPGDFEGFHDQRIEVTARVLGAGHGEPVTLFYSTEDGQVVDQAVPMRLPEGNYRYTAELPADKAGLQQNLQYHIEAGDAISPRYHVRVLTTPAIAVDSLDYEYPPYTGIAPRRVERQGDIQALEGTKVTITASANQQIQSAYVDFERDGHRDLIMKTHGRQAFRDFRLALKKNRREPQHDSYQLRFTNSDGHENPKPNEYKIEVIADLPPEIAFVEPSVEPGQPQPLAQGGVLRMVVGAGDPDFKLARVTLMAERNGKLLLNQSLLAEPQSGSVQQTFIFDTRQYRLEPSDRVVYWAVAEDNKHPEPNRSQTARYTLQITSPLDEQQRQDQLAQAGRPTEEPGDGERQNEDGSPHDQNDASPEQGEGQPQQDQPNQGDAQQGGSQQSGDAEQGASDQDASGTGQGRAAAASIPTLIPAKRSRRSTITSTSSKPTRSPKRTSRHRAKGTSGLRRATRATAHNRTPVRLHNPVHTRIEPSSRTQSPRPVRLTNPLSTTRIGWVHSPSRPATIPTAGHPTQRRLNPPVRNPSRHKATGSHLSRENRGRNPMVRANPPQARSLRIRAPRGKPTQPARTPVPSSHPARVKATRPSRWTKQMNPASLRGRIRSHPMPEAVTRMA